MPGLKEPESILDACPLVKPIDFDAIPDRLPVTLLSGFLGSGKTTLLEWILKSKDHGLKVAVIVNDMGEINIDANLLDTHKLTQTVEKVVQFENGCICCTLRGDLLEEVAILAEAKQFDYLIIESTGISEPQQVAESFAPEFAEMHIQAAFELRQEAERVKAEAKARQNGSSSEDAVTVEVDEASTARLEALLSAGGLSRLARLDTCVTVVDAVSFMGNFATPDFLSDRQDPSTVDEKDERNISDLMVDQLEFANVVIINKTDLVDAPTLTQIKGLVKSLNPDAEILTSVRSRIDLKHILDTKKFSMSQSILSAGWLKSLREEVKPETEEYGIGSFVYRARRPFSPLRLWEFVRHRLVVIQDSYEEILDRMAAEKGEASDDEMDSDSGYETEPEETESMDEDPQPQLDAAARLKAKQADPAFGPLLRSKGFFWLATRPMLSGEWSQAGVMLTVSGGTRWLCETAEENWPQDPEAQAKMREDFQGEWGDRRQELVFIGQSIKTIKPLLTAELDSCLLNDLEWRQWNKIMKSKSSLKSKVQQLQDIHDDGWEEWLDEEDSELMAELGLDSHQH